VESADLAGATLGAVHDLALGLTGSSSDDSSSEVSSFLTGFLLTTFF